MRTYLNIPTASSMTVLREKGIAERAALQARIKTFTGNLRRRVFSDIFVSVIEEAALGGLEHVAFTIGKVRKAFVGADDDVTNAMDRLLQKVILWSQEDPNAWDLETLGFDLTNDEGRMNCARELYEMAFFTKNSPEEAGIFYEIVMDLLPEFNTAGYTMKYHNTNECRTYFTVSGW